MFVKCVNVNSCTSKTDFKLKKPSINWIEKSGAWLKKYCLFMVTVFRVFYVLLFFNQAF